MRFRDIPLWNREAAQSLPSPDPEPKKRKSSRSQSSRPKREPSALELLSRIIAQVQEKEGKQGGRKDEGN